MSIDIKKLKALAEAATGFSDVSLAPDMLLELIDQNERLTKNYKSLCDSVAHLNAATTSAGDEVARLRAENESANSRLHEVAVACATAEQERDQLRAEVAGLKTGYEAYERVNAGLKAEVEGLRKDRTDWQAECLKRGFEYVRESDDHYVLADVPEMADLLGSMLGVEVRSKENDGYEEANSQLNEQIEGLINTIHSQESMRKDAERWRFVRNPTATGSPFAVWSERANLFLGKFADEAIDSAMSQGEQS